MNTNKPKLFHKDFTLVVAGQIISLFGNAVLRFALPLYLLRETGSPALFGAVTAASFVPMILLSLMGGVLADRVNKRNIMVLLDFGTAGLIALFYLALGRLPTVPLFIVFLMLLYGISGAYQPAVQASIPLLVPTEKLMEGNAVINQVNTLAGLLGPVIGGILFNAWGILPILAVGTVCFALSAAMELLIHIPYHPIPAGPGVLATVRQDLCESWRFVRCEKPEFLQLTLVLAVFNLVLSASMVVGLPVIVVNVLGRSDTALGIAQGAQGLGGLAGGMLAGALGSRIKLSSGRKILAVCGLTAVGMGLALLPGVPVTAAYWLVTLMNFAAMAASTLFSVQIFTVLQQQTPPALLGKITATLMAVAACAHPVGQALYGVLFDVCAPIPWAVMLGAGAAAMLTALYAKQVFLRLERA